MVRKLSESKYIVAFTITFLFFLTGLLIGVTMSNYRVQSLETFSELQRLEYDSLQLQYQYLSSLIMEEENCPALMSALEVNLANLEKARMKLEGYISRVESDKDQYMVLKKDYTLAEIRYWFLLNEVKGKCDIDVVSIIYFYSIDSTCKSCDTQGLILNELKDEFKDKLLIFALDLNFDEAMIKILKESYGVKIAPSLIIDGSLVEGFIKRDDLLNKLCENYEKEVDAC